MTINGNILSFNYSNLYGQDWNSRVNKEHEEENEESLSKPAIQNEATSYDLDLSIVRNPQNFGIIKNTDQTEPPSDCYQCDQSRGSHCMNCF